MIGFYAAAHGLRATSLRYFDVAGAYRAQAGGFLWRTTNPRPTCSRAF